MNKEIRGTEIGEEIKHAREKSMSSTANGNHTTLKSKQYSADARDKIRQQYDALQASYQEISKLNTQLQEYQRVLIETNRKLKESEERLELAIWGTDEGIWDWNIQTGEVYYSDRWKSMLGYESSEPMGHINIWLNLIHVDDMPVVQNALQDHLEGKTYCYQTEHQLKTKSGEWIWVLDRGKVVARDLNGKPLRMVGTKRDITRSKLSEEKIRYLSFNDSLTDVYNRAFFEEEIRRLDASRQLPLSIIMGDVNGLKLLNDAFGHYEGDKLLVNMARILKKSCREEDIIARWGGDEFVVLLPQTGSNTASEICSRIKQNCEYCKTGLIKPSIALGTATKENDEQDIFKVMQEAENIMYRNKLLESKNTRNIIMKSLELTLPERTGESCEHTSRLQKLALQLGRCIGLAENELDRLAVLSNLHDIGKVGIPQDILKKTGPLSAEEWEIVKKHPEIGFRIVQSSPEFPSIAEEILAHRERWDGKGYPKGLKGEEIPLLSRILAVVDAFDVMTSSCSYKNTVSHTDALEEIKSCAGTQFDPEIVSYFLEFLKLDSSNGLSDD
jgi:diguanylate cyclase (GGDEF)-like protein/PAS domain S-box-containing protein